MIFPFVKTNNSIYDAPPAYGTLYAWYWAHDNTFMTVNSNGTGGAPADGGSVGRLVDRSGNGLHLTNTATTTQPVYRAGRGLNFFWQETGTGSYNQALLANTSMSISRANCSGGAIVDLPGMKRSAIITLDTATPTNSLAIYATQKGFGYLPSGAFVDVTSSTMTPSSRKCIVTWRSNGSNFIIRINGVEDALAAVTAATCTQCRMGEFAGGNNKPISIYEQVIYNTDIGDTNIKLLESYFRRMIGSYNNSRTVVCYGDSLTMAVGSANVKPWHDQSYISNRLSSKWYACAGDGDFLNPASITAAQINSLKGSDEGVVVVWIGTNDIHSGNSTGATTETNLHTYCTTLKGAGNKVIVATLQAFVTNNAERVTFNTNVKANYTGYADAIVKLDEAVELSDSTNLTYFQFDGVHLTDAGYAVAAGLFQTALASV